MKNEQMKNNIPHKFVNATKEHEHVMTIDGAIGESNVFYQATSAKDVKDALQGVTASTIRIKLNSGGGDVFDGIEIYNYLKELEAKVIVEVTALAASAASIIAMAADEIIMRTGSTMMIHEASTVAYGTKADIQKTMNALEAIDESIVAIYAERTGKSAEELRNMITAETWFTADEAVVNGFATATDIVEETTALENNDDLINTIVEKVTAQLKNSKNDEPTPQPQKVAAKKRVIF